MNGLYTFRFGIAILLTGLIALLFSAELQSGVKLIQKTIFRSHANFRVTENRYPLSIKVVLIFLLGNRGYTKFIERERNNDVNVTIVTDGQIACFGFENATELVNWTGLSEGISTCTCCGSRCKGGTRMKAAGITHLDTMHTLLSGKYTAYACEDCGDDIVSEIFDQNVYGSEDLVVATV